MSKTMLIMQEVKDLSMRKNKTANGPVLLAQLGAVLQKKHGITPETLGVKKLAEFFRAQTKLFTLSEGSNMVSLASTQSLFSKSEEISDNLCSFCYMPWGRVVADIKQKIDASEWEDDDDLICYIKSQYNAGWVERALQRTENLIIFHSGLYTPQYSPIYVVLEKKEDSRWQYAGVCVRGDSMAKRVFSELQVPRRPSYGREVFDPSRPIEVDIDHLTRRGARIPFSFLKVNTPKGFTPKEIVSKEDESEYNEAYRDALIADAEMYEQTRALLEYAVMQAMRRAESDYNDVLLTWNYKRGLSSFLLPLKLGRETVALLINKEHPTTYQAATILSREQARNSARVCSTLSKTNWLLAA